MKSRSRVHRGHRIVMRQLGATWNAIVYGRLGEILAAGIEGPTARDVMDEALRRVDAPLPRRPAGRPRR